MKAGKKLPNTRQKWMEGIFGGMFMILLAAPVVQMIVKAVPEPKLPENRKLEEWSRLREVKWQEIPLSFETVFNDRFGFRETLLWWGSRWEAEVLASSPVPSIVIGKHGWLYFYAEKAGEQFKFGTYTLDDHMGKVPLGEEELEKMADIWQTNKNWLDERGIRLVLLIVPEKQTIYPEFLPDEMRNRGRKTRREQIYEVLRAKTDIDVIDLEKALVESKSKYPVFYKTEYHWNKLGAGIGFGETMNYLRKWYPELPEFTWDNYEIRTQKIKGLFLAQQMAGENRYEDTEISLEAKTEYKVDEKDAPHLLIMNDSFFSESYPFGSNHFFKAVLPKVTVYSHGWEKFNREIVEEVKPEVVVYEVAERMQESLLLE